LPEEPAFFFDLRKSRSLASLGMTTESTFCAASLAAGLHGIELPLRLLSRALAGRSQIENSSEDFNDKTNYLQRDAEFLNNFPYHAGI
jgi:hypothetical protein